MEDLEAEKIGAGLPCSEYFRLLFAFGILLPGGRIVKQGAEFLLMQFFYRNLEFPLAVRSFFYSQIWQFHSHSGLS
jgi:hypothetical protein